MGTKVTTRDALIAAATRLFLDRGLGTVPMEEVAAEAGCTRRNLYRYYSAKEELAFDVATAVLTRWNEEQQRLFAAAEGSGARRLRVFLNSLVDALEPRRAELCFLGEFDFALRDIVSYHPDGERWSQFLQASLLTETLVGRLLDEGLNDASLVLPLPRQQLIPAMTTALWSMAQRVALRDQRLADEYGVSGLALLRTQVSLLLRALSPQGVSNEGI